MVWRSLQVRWTGERHWKDRTPSKSFEPCAASAPASWEAPSFRDLLLSRWESPFFLDLLLSSSFPSFPLSLSFASIDHGSVHLQASSRQLSKFEVSLCQAFFPAFSSAVPLLFVLVFSFFDFFSAFFEGPLASSAAATWSPLTCASTKLLEASAMPGRPGLPACGLCDLVSLQGACCIAKAPGLRRLHRVPRSGGYLFVRSSSC